MHQTYTHLLFLLALLGQARADCPPCATLNRDAVGDCVCGDCLNGFHALIIGGAPSRQCLAEAHCPAHTYLDRTSLECTACPVSFTAAACQSCQLPSQLCVSCNTADKYNATCVPRQAPSDNTTVQMAPVDAYADLADTSTHTRAEIGNLTAIPSVSNWVAVLQTYLYHPSGIVPDVHGRVLDSDGYVVDQARQTWVHECVGAFYVPLFYQFSSNTTCDVFECPPGTFDHDVSAATPCRRLL